MTAKTKRILITTEYHEILRIRLAGGAERDSSTDEELDGSEEKAASELERRDRSRMKET